MRPSLTRNRVHPIRMLRSSGARAKAVKEILRFKPSIEMSVAKTIKDTAKRFPGHKALLFEGNAWTYREFDEAIDRRAIAIAALGITAGESVALMMDNRPEFLFNAYALNRLGVVAALINTNLQGPGLCHGIRIADAKAAIVGAEHLDVYQDALAGADDLELQLLLDTEAGAPQVKLPKGAHNLTEAANAVTDLSFDAPTVLGRDLMAYIYTSGTTGLPKAGRILNARARLAATGFGGFALGMGRWDTFYCCLPLFHSNGFLVASATALCTGATLALSRKFSASKFWDEVRSSESTVFVYIGEICRYLLAQPEREDDANHKLRAVIGNGMRPEVWEEFVRRHRPGVIHEFYGATEGNVNMVNLTGKFGSVGKMPPLAKLNNALLVRFDHDTQQPYRGPDGRCVRCEPDEPGELLGRINTKVISQRFDGYANPEATKKKVLTDVLVEGDAYFRSGDLLKQDAKGYYYFVDRIGDTFRWKGENVSTNEVADAIQIHGDIEIANVYGVRLDGADGKPGMVAIVPAAQATFDPAEFYAHVKGVLPVYARPAFVRVASSVELTATFKLRKVDLVGAGFDPSVVPDPVFYRDDAASTFVPLDGNAHKKILAGKIRF